MANDKKCCRITVLRSGSVVFYGMSDFFGIRLKSGTHRDTAQSLSPVSLSQQPRKTICKTGQAVIPHFEDL